MRTPLIVVTEDKKIMWTTLSTLDKQKSRWTALANMAAHILTRLFTAASFFAHFAPPFCVVVVVVWKTCKVKIRANLCPDQTFTSSRFSEFI
jgi:hypothetical protein